MASETEIANAALYHLGAEAIASLDEASSRSEVLKLRYPMVRDALLRAYPWNFAAARAALPAMATAPAFEFTYQYLVPGDYLWLRDLPDAAMNDRYVVEHVAGGRAILCDLGAPLSIKYTRRVKETGYFDPLFVEAFGLQLALAVAKRVTDREIDREALKKLRDDAIAEARRLDAQEGRAESLPTGTWFDERSL